MELIYLNDSNISEAQYDNFIQKFYGDRYNQKKSRNQWYSQLGDKYKVLLAVDNGEILGQNCAYSVMASYNGEDINIWWGVDAFVLKEHRGKGIGTLLQKKLHEDLPNFTSASYSRPNGTIKRKLGDRPLFMNCHHYYGVSSYAFVYLSLACKKIFGKSMFSEPGHGIPYIYSLFRRSKVNLQDAVIDVELAGYIDGLLAGRYDFYVKRTKNLLQWKYINNPSIESNIKYIFYKGKKVGFVAYSNPMSCDLAGTPVNSIKITDLIVEPQCGISSRDVVCAFLKECRILGYHIDGILSIPKLKGLPSINYHNIDVLSSMQIKNPIVKPYLTLLDQDMEQ